jgi:heat shock protein HtpX
MSSFLIVNKLSLYFFNLDMLFFLEYIPLKEYQLALIVFAWGFTGGLINNISSKWQIKKIYNLKKIEEGTVIFNTVHKINNKISKKLKVKPAQLHYYTSNEKNAFVCGFSKNNALLALSSNLLHSLSENELESVMYHEYAHIINGDMTTQQILEGVITSYLLFSSKIIQLALIKGSSISNSIFIIALGTVFEWFFLFLAKLFFLWFSRHRELVADKFAVQNQGSYFCLLSALQNISNQEESSTSNDLLGKKIFNIYEYKNDVLSTHPNFNNRVINIEKSI